MLNNISVVIPAYNRAHTIGRCLDSIISQTHPAFEIIIVDDCSTDDLPAALVPYSQHNVVLIRHETNKGAQAARNTGIKAAKGNWIAFQDSDDEWLSNKLELQINILKSYNYDEKLIIHGNGLMTQGDGHFSLHLLPQVEGDSKTCKILLLKSPGPVFQALLLSKKKLEQIGYLDERAVTHQEWETSIRLAEVGSFIFVKDPLFIWHLHDGESISRHKINHIKGYHYIVEKHASSILELADGKEVWFYHHYNLASKSLEIGDQNLFQSFNKELKKYNKRESIQLSICIFLKIKPSMYAIKLESNLKWLVEIIFRVKKFYNAI